MEPYKLKIPALLRAFKSVVFMLINHAANNDVHAQWSVLAKLANTVQTTTEYTCLSETAAH